MRLAGEKVLPAETFEMVKNLLTVFLSKPRKKAEALLKRYELFIC
jgi:hypothetical protein